MKTSDLTKIRLLQIKKKINFADCFTEYTSLIECQAFEIGFKLAVNMLIDREQTRRFGRALTSVSFFIGKIFAFAIWLIIWNLFFAPICLQVVCSLVVLSQYKVNFLVFGTNNLSQLIQTDTMGLLLTNAQKSILIYSVKLSMMQQ